VSQPTLRPKLTSIVQKEGIFSPPTSTNIHQQSLLIHIHKKKNTIHICPSLYWLLSRNHGFRPQAPRGFKALGHGSKLHHGIMRLNGGDLEGITGHSEASALGLLLVFWEISRMLHASVTVIIY
jgi:hypothetical protein